jgi:hypothetical protein
LAIVTGVFPFRTAGFHLKHAAASAKRRAFAFLELPVYEHTKGFSQDEHRQHATEIQEREPAEPRPQ